MSWFKEKEKDLVDMGAPLGNAMLVKKNADVSVKSDVTGYSIIEAENMESAVKILHDHPHVDWSLGCNIEVFEAEKIGV